MSEWTPTSTEEHTSVEERLATPFVRLVCALRDSLYRYSCILRVMQYYRDFFFRTNGTESDYSPADIAGICKDDLVAFLGYIGTFSELSAGDIGTLLKMRRGMMWCQSIFNFFHEAGNNLWKVMRLVDEDQYEALGAWAICKQVKPTLLFLFGRFASNVAAVSAQRKKVLKASKGPSKCEYFFTLDSYRVACDGRVEMILLVFWNKCFLFSDGCLQEGSWRKV